jgi:ribosomal protein S18 acetylase RimI-like enzyme
VAITARAIRKVATAIAIRSAYVELERLACSRMDPSQPLDLATVEVGDTRPDEIAEAVAVAARAMSTSPMSTAVIRGDRAKRIRYLTMFFGRLYAAARHQRPLVARLDGRVIASTNDLVGGACRFGARERLSAVPDLLRTPPAITLRSARWLNAWERRDPDAPHSHYGPFGVEPEFQGRGIGSLVMVEYTRRLDAAGEDAYLETDKPENVALYSRFGFEVVEEAEVLDTPNWFMWRRAGADAPATRHV